MAERVKALYTADGGTTYNVLTMAWMVNYTANPFGYGSYDSARPKLPNYIKKRYITLKESGGVRHRKVPCGTSTCSAYTVAAVSYTLPNADATTGTYVQDGKVGEKTRGY